MIPVTRLDGSPLVVNVDQIAWIEGLPDTVISMMNGEKLLVRETPEMLIELAQEFKRATVLPVLRSVSASARSEVRRGGDTS
jgi:flagellar protein FlbD